MTNPLFLDAVVTAHQEELRRLAAGSRARRARRRSTARRDAAAAATRHALPSSWAPARAALRRLLRPLGHGAGGDRPPAEARACLC